MEPDKLKKANDIDSDIKAYDGTIDIINSANTGTAINKITITPKDIALENGSTVYVIRIVKDIDFPYMLKQKIYAALREYQDHLVDEKEKLNKELLDL